MDVTHFITKAAQEKLIKAGSIESTQDFLKEADLKLAAIRNNSDSVLSKKLQDNGEIHPNYISKAYALEQINGKELKRPMVDLVQQGGGMYGIALLGYTYILEKVGIRFYSYGGTSAGAINATFLAAISNKVYTQKSIFFKDDERLGTKSEILTHIIINTDFSSFMEREGVVGKLQRMLFKNFGRVSYLGAFGLISAVVGFLLIFIYGLFGLVYRSSNGFTGFELRTFDFFLGTLNVLAVGILFYVFFIRILGKRFGLNKGEVFFKWCNGLLNLLDIFRTDGLMSRMAEIDFHQRTKNDVPRLVLIASNLTHNRIVKFPDRAPDYWHNPSNVMPSAYLRASMSLPFIFEVFVPSTQHYHDDEPNNKMEKEARFVDGGMLSNFPIREFHRMDGKLPRFPTFGVLLSKLREDKNTKKTLEKSSLLSYVMSYLKTFRYFYDKDFINTSREIEKRVVTVDTKDYNWLDFWMDQPTTKKLFMKGVDAAIEQLEKFDWSDYIKIREKEMKETQSMKL